MCRSLCDTRSGVSQNHPDSCLTDLRTVKERGQGVAALMRCVLHFDLPHGLVPEPTEAVIGGAGADDARRFPFCEYPQDTVMDGDFTDPGGCL